MNGSGIQPTVELATTNGNAYPVYPMFNGMGNGGSGFWGGEGIWIILIIALLGGFGNNGNGGFGGWGGNNDFAWLSNGQKDIMNNTTDGFNTLHLSNQIEGVKDGINGISTQLCNGFANAEISANARQVADMNQNFNNQISTLQAFNGLSSQLAQCCCDNRLATANLNSTIISENCADRQALNEGVRDILANQTASVQRILDQLCQDKIDAKNEKIADLERQLSMKDLQASQIAQNSFIAQGFANEVDALYNRLSNCPVPSTPVYGRTPIFTCNNGCGCGGNFNNLI